MPNGEKMQVTVRFQIVLDVIRDVFRCLDYAVPKLA